MAFWDDLVGRFYIRVGRGLRTPMINHTLIIDADDIRGCECVFVCEMCRDGASRPTGLDIVCLSIYFILKILLVCVGLGLRTPTIDRTLTINTDNANNNIYLKCFCMRNVSGWWHPDLRGWTSSRSQVGAWERDDIQKTDGDNIRDWTLLICVGTNQSLCLLPLIVLYL